MGSASVRWRLSLLGASGRAAWGEPRAPGVWGQVTQRGLRGWEGRGRRRGGMWPLACEGPAEMPVGRLVEEMAMTQGVVVYTGHPARSPGGPHYGFGSQDRRLLLQQMHTTRQEQLQEIESDRRGGVSAAEEFAHTGSRARKLEETHQKPDC